MGAELVRVRYVFRGRVQGVGFRYRAADFATALGLTGFVRNQRDGSVELEAQGTQAQLDELLGSLRTSPFIRIDQVTATPRAPRKDREFLVAS